MLDRFLPIPLRSFSPLIHAVPCRSLPPSVWAGLLVVLVLLAPLTGCDSTGMEPDETSQFEATFRGAFNADLKGGTEYRTFEGDALLDMFTNVCLLLTDDNRRSNRAIYFTRRDTSALTVGTYSLLDLVSADDATKRDPERVWAYIFGGRDDGYADGFAYSQGGTADRGSHDGAAAGHLFVSRYDAGRHRPGKRDGRGGDVRVRSSVVFYGAGLG